MRAVKFYLGSEFFYYPIRKGTKKHNVRRAVFHSHGKHWVDGSTWWAEKRSTMCKIIVIGFPPDYLFFIK